MGPGQGGLFEAADGTGHITRAELRDKGQDPAEGLQRSDVGQSTLRVLCLQGGEGILG